MVGERIGPASEGWQREVGCWDPFKGAASPEL